MTEALGDPHPGPLPTGEGREPLARRKAPARVTLARNSSLCYAEKPGHLEEMSMPDTPSLEEFVAQQLKSGKYQSYEELVQTGLRLLQEREQELDHIADALRSAMQDYLHGDRGAEVDIEAIKATGRTRLAQSSGLS